MSSSIHGPSSSSRGPNEIELGQYPSVRDRVGPPRTEAATPLTPTPPPLSEPVFLVD